MFTIMYHVLYPLTESDGIPKKIKILRNINIEVSFKDISIMLSSEDLLNYFNWIITFIVQTNSFGKQSGAVISFKTIAFLLRILIHLQRNYTMT